MEGILQNGMGLPTHPQLKWRMHLVVTVLSVLYALQILVLVGQVDWQSYWTVKAKGPQLQAIYPAGSAVLKKTGNGLSLKTH